MNRHIPYLFALQRFGIKAGLKNISSLLDELGHPERDYPCVHVAGTNGKGSTAAMIASVLTSAGYRTGLYTSPHLLRFNERIRIDGQEIGDHDIAEYTRSMRRSIDRTRSTFFEATTAMAFRYFADRKVDIAVIETGLGGRLDATNVVTPLLSIITSISYDHMEYLGSTIRAIAREKGGIIKRGVPCIIGVEGGDALRIIRGITLRRHSRMIVARDAASVKSELTGIEDVTVDIRTRSSYYNNLRVGLGGSHQVRNARLALLAVEQLNRSFARIQPDAIREGLSSIRKNTGFRGRSEVLSRKPLIIGDVGHNPDAIRTISHELLLQTGRKLPVVFGVMKDKDVDGIAKELKSLARVVLAVSPDTPRAMTSSALAENFRRHSIAALDARSVGRGIRLGLNERRQSEPILLAGSHFVVGEGIAYLRAGGN